MAFDPSKIVNPMQFSDLGAITGLNENTQQPVVPPVFDPTQRVEQAIAPISSKYQSAMKLVQAAVPYAQMPTSSSVSSMSGSYDFSSSPHR